MTRDVLSGIKVIDFGQYLAAPMVTMFLADFGADVVRVDPPGGPRWNHPVNATLQRGKRSIVLDLARTGDLATARDLIDGADIVLEGFRPGVMDRLGLPADQCLSRNPGLIWCALPGFGRDDPRAGVAAWEGIIAAAAGLYPPYMFAIDGDPAFTALPLPSVYGAMVAAHRVAAALIARHRFGHGCHLELPLFDSAFQAIGLTAEVPWSRAGSNLSDFDTFRRLERAKVTGFHRSRDGRYFEVEAPARGAYALAEFVRPGLDIADAADPALAEIGREFDDAWRSRTAVEWERLGQEVVGASVGAVRSAAEWLADAHAASSRCVIEVDDPLIGPTRQAGFPVWLSCTVPAVRSPRRVPGADQDDVLRELAEPPLDPLQPDANPGHGSVHGDRVDKGPPRERPTSVESGQDEERPPLDGVRVVDASIILAGPSTGRILAQYGAEVLKIEKPAIANGTANMLSDDPICLVGHRTVNAGKRMMYLDLATDAGRGVLGRLLQRADVVHHNFTPTAAKRLGLDLDAVRRIRSDAVYSRTSLHSEGGHREAYRGHEPLGQHVTGISHRHGGEGTPRYMGLPVNDNGTGHLSAFGILLALYHRYRTGAAQEVNAALSRTATMLQLPYLLSYSGQLPDEPAGRAARGWGPFNRLYRAADRWFYLCHEAASARDRLRTVPMLTEIDGADADSVAAWLETRFATREAAEWVRLLTEHGISAHLYRNLADNLNDDLLWERGIFAVLDHPGLGPAVGIAIPRHWGTADRQRLLPARRPGMDTIDVLDEYGFTAAEIVSLLRSGAIATGENPVVATTSAPDTWLRYENLPWRPADVEMRRIFPRLSQRVSSSQSSRTIHRSSRRNPHRR